MKPVPKPKMAGKKKRPKKESYKSLVSKADSVFSLYVRNLYSNTCVTCGSKQRPTCSHLITRTKRSVRWDIDNVTCQCAPCNFRHEYHPQYLTAWWINKYGAEAYQRLVEKSNKIKKHTREELHQIIEAYSL